MTHIKALTIKFMLVYRYCLNSKRSVTCGRQKVDSKRSSILSVFSLVTTCVSNEESAGLRSNDSDFTSPYNGYRQDKDDDDDEDDDDVQPR